MGLEKGKVKKRCRTCLKYKLFKHFHKHKQYQSGRDSLCKLCHNENNRERYKTNKLLGIGNERNILSVRFEQN